MSRPSPTILPVILALLPVLAGCGPSPSSALDRELAQSREDEARAFAVSRAADHFADEQRMRALRVITHHELAFDPRDEP